MEDTTNEGKSSSSPCQAEELIEIKTVNEVPVLQKELEDEESSDNAEGKTDELFRRGPSNTEDGFDISKSRDKGEGFEKATEIAEDAVFGGQERFQLENQLKNLTDGDGGSAISEPSQSAAEVNFDDNMARFGSSQSVDDCDLDDFIHDVLTKASRPDVAIPWSPSELAAESPSASCLQEPYEKKPDEPEKENEQSNNEKNSSSIDIRASIGGGSPASRTSRTVSVGLLSSPADNTPNKILSASIFDLDKPTGHIEVKASNSSVKSPKLITVASADPCNEDAKKKEEDQLSVTSAARNKAVSMHSGLSVTSVPKAGDPEMGTEAKQKTPEPPLESGSPTPVIGLKETDDSIPDNNCIILSSVQTKEGQDIFVIDPSKIPNKRDFAQKKEYKEAINSLCLYVKQYIETHKRSEKFSLLVHAQDDTRSRMKSREAVTKFYKLLKDSFSDRLLKCVIYRPEFKLMAMVHICRPFFQNSMRNKFSTAKHPRNLVDSHGLPETVLRM